MSKDSELATTSAEVTEAHTLWSQANEAARLCKEIVMKTSRKIGDRNYVQVEGWTAIATVHGCVTTIKSVEQDQTGVRAVAELRRVRDNRLISSAEGFVGVDEPVWYGGTITKWSERHQKEITKHLPRRADFAIRAMAQTRATSRVCRGPFSHVIVLIGEGLSTTPAEEMADDDSIDVDAHESKAPEAASSSNKAPEVPRDEAIKLRAQFEGRKWEKVAIHFGADKGVTLGEMAPAKFKFWLAWQPKSFGGRPPSHDDIALRAALDAAELETQSE